MATDLGDFSLSDTSGDWLMNTPEEVALPDTTDLSGLWADNGWAMSTPEDINSWMTPDLSNSLDAASSATGWDAELQMPYWEQPDGSILYQPYVGEGGLEFSPTGDWTGNRLEDIVGTSNVTTPSATGWDAELQMPYWEQPDGSILYQPYVDEKGMERDPSGGLTGRTIEDIVGKENVTVPSGQVPSRPNTAAGSMKELVQKGLDVIRPDRPQPSSGNGSGTYSNPVSAVKDALQGITGTGGGQQSGNNWMQMLMMMLLLSQMNKGGSSGAANAVIPQLTATRTLNSALPQQMANRRPGSAPLQYFQQPNAVQYAAEGGVMGGGLASLGQYAAGGKGRLVAGDGDGVSDDIPATIDGQQPARIARGEYVIPARVVAELGNGSTDAGAERLDNMVAQIESSGRKAKRGTDSKAYNHLPT